jgi:2-dehydro-3-deoxygluconokinase
LFSVYSVPLNIWKENGELNEQVIRTAINRAVELGAKFVKLSLGGYDPLKSNVNGLKELLLELDIENQKLQVTVENDQTCFGGNVRNLYEFLEQCSVNGVPVGMTFDIGNWSWTGEDAYKAAETLGKYVVYIHCKHAEFNSSEWITLPLPSGENSKWRDILSILPKDVPRAIEFPIHGENLEQVTGEYVKLLANA